MCFAGGSTPTSCTVTATWPGCQTGCASAAPSASSPSAWRPSACAASSWQRCRRRTLSALVRVTILPLSISLFIWHFFYHSHITVPVKKKKKSMENGCIVFECKQQQSCLLLSSLNCMGGDQVVVFFSFVRIIGFQLTSWFSNYFFCFNVANDINVSNQLSVDNLVFLKGRALQLTGIQRKGNKKRKSESVDKCLDFRTWGADFIPGTETGF